MLSRQSLLNSFTRRFVIVDTPAGQVRIRNLTEGERSDLDAGSVTADGKINLRHIRTQRCRLAALVVVDAAGDVLLNQAGDSGRMKDLDASVIEAIWEAAREHCGMEDATEGETEKNSEPTQD